MSGESGSVYLVIFLLFNVEFGDLNVMVVVLGLNLRVEFFFKIYVENFVFFCVNVDNLILMVKVGGSIVIVFWLDVMGIVINVKFIV